MSFETCNNRDVDLCQGDEMSCQNCNEKQPQKLYSCDARKKAFKTLKGRNLHVAKSRNCDRQSDLNCVIQMNTGQPTVYQELTVLAHILYKGMFQYNNSP